MNAQLVQSEQYKKILLGQIHSAQKEILGTVYSTYLDEEKNSHPTTEIFKELVQAWDRQVLVKVLLNGESKSDRIKKGNTLAQEYLKKNNVLVMQYPNNVTLHAKVWIFDGIRTLLGSHNLSGNSLTSNVELSVLIHDEQFAQHTKEFFRRYWENAQQKW